MEPMLIEATNNSPRVELKTNGEMIIHGRSILENPISFYNPIIEWVKNCQASKLTVKIQIEYMNTSSHKLMMNLLKSIKDKYSLKDVSIKWYYEEDDEDILETGKNYEHLLQLPIDFYEISSDVR